MATTEWLDTRGARWLCGVIGWSLVVPGVAVAASGWVDGLLIAAISRQLGVPPAPDWAGRFQLLGLEAILSGLPIAALGWLILPRRVLIVSLLQRNHLLAVAAGLLLIALWLPVVVTRHSTTFGGETYWWLLDDAMVSMRYARNLASGVGLVWNPGERVEGYTNFLWALSMALIHVLPIPAAKTSLVVLVTNLGLAIAAIPATIRLVRSLGGGTLATTAAVAGYVLSKHAMSWTTEGFETALLTLLLLIATDRVLQESQQQPRLSTAILIATMSLVRADTAVLAVLWYGAWILLNQNRKRALAYALISLLLPAAHEIFRLVYYGDILPNTAYLKAMSWNGRFAAGIGYVLDFARDYALLIGFAAAGSLSSGQWPRRLLFGALLIDAAYIAYAGGDAFQNARFFVPVLPLLMALAFTALQHRGWRQSRRVILSAAGLLTMPLIVPGYAAILSPSPDDVGNIRIGLWLKQQTPAASTVADFWAGSVFYFSERHGVDLLGKSDRYVAHLPASSDGTKPGHNKFDFNYSLGVLRPDFVVANFKLPVGEEQMRQAATGDGAFTGQLYFNPVFREHCLPHPVTTETWRTIFVCDWSPELSAFTSSYYGARRR